MGHSVLIVGAGGREHALGWALTRSPSVDRVASAPGNPGLAALGAVHPIDAENPVAVADLAQRLSVDLVVVGPEAPLVAGVVDELARREIPAFGPTASAAAIEGSKAFAKDVMLAAGAPTGAYLATSDRDQARSYLDACKPPYVIKADGLAAGKGVRICDTIEEARDAVDDVLVRGVFGDAGSVVVVEEFLDGPERSVFAVCDGVEAVLLSPAQDYKRAFDGDEGLNTGGMGAYTPVPGFGLTEAEHLRDLIFRPVLRELASRGTPYQGLLYAGLVDTAEGPKLLEFNARFGDPETQVILPRLASDLGALLWASATGSVADVDVAWHDHAVVTVVLASSGYPQAYETGKDITGIEDAEALDDVIVFHAGTRAEKEDGRVLTNGGRVLNVTARSPTVSAARARAYEAADRIRWDGVHRREDIAADV